MIEIFKFDGKWRLKIVNETFEFKCLEDMNKYLPYLLKEKDKFEPNKK